MDDLVRWLTACLDEDERIARAACGRLNGQWSHDSSIPNGYVYDERGEAVVYDESAPLPEEAEHIAAHDPARVLREIDADRRLLAEYERAANAYPADSRAYDYESETGRERTTVLEWVVRLRAARFSERAGYREEWAVDDTTWG